MELLDCALIGVCAVIRLNMVYCFCCFSYIDSISAVFNNGHSKAEVFVAGLEILFSCCLSVCFWGFFLFFF